MSSPGTLLVRNYPGITEIKKVSIDSSNNVVVTIVFGGFTEFEIHKTGHDFKILMTDLSSERKGAVVSNMDELGAVIEKWDAVRRTSNKLITVAGIGMEYTEGLRKLIKDLDSV